VDRLQRIIGSAGRLAGLSARLDYARPPYPWGDFTDVFREQAWRARMNALRAERAAIAEFNGGLDRDAAVQLAWTEMTGKLDGAIP
jgi:hypothetical protein